MKPFCKMSDPVAFIKNRILTVSKPSKQKTLLSATAKWLETEDEKFVVEIVEKMKQQKFLSIDETGKVAYL